MITFTKTRSAADYISRHTTSDLTRSRALVLLKRLGVCEAALAATGGDPGLAHSLLRGLVPTAGELAGPAWRSANTDDPDIAAFTAWATHPPLHPPLTSTSSSPGCCGRAPHPPSRAAQTDVAAAPGPAAAHPLWWRQGRALDPLTARQGSAPVEENGAEQVLAAQTQRPQP
jgi:hypothetical protein